MNYISRAFATIVFFIIVLFASTVLAEDIVEAPAASTTPETTIEVSIEPEASSTATVSAASSGGSGATSTDPVLDIEGNVDVPAECDVVDTDGTTHHFPATSSPSAYLGICALAAALESGLISDADFSNQFPSIGLFITSINDIAADPSSEYWALYLNGDFADCGLSCLAIAEGDEIELQLEDFSGTDLGDSLRLHVKSLIATSTPHLNIEGHVDVPARCDIIDTDGVSHHYETASSSAYVGICALSAAKDADIIESAQFSNQFPSIGLFVIGINDVLADPSSEYWALYHNGSFANCGIGCLSIAVGDSIELQLHDFSDTDLGDSLTLHIDSLLATSTSSGQATTTPPEDDDSSDDDNTGGGSSSHDQFDVESALSYLASVQLSDGSFSSPMLTDWVAIAFASSGSSDAKTKMKEYLKTASPSLTSVTDYERHAMALQAHNINPYTGTAHDYIAPITDAFDGTQIGDTSLDNDDIFAIFPLMNAGYGTNDEIIKKTVAFIISRQKSDGSWDSSVDVTAAAIQALSLTSSLQGVSEAILEGKTYLHEKQQEDGGWENSFSTSWALQAIAALNESESSWTTGNHTPEEFLSSLQESDGGVDSMSTSETMRTWATAYAIPAVQNKTWDDLLASFKKPTGATKPSASTIPAATTPKSATSTPTAFEVATTTPLVLGASTSTIPALAPAPIEHPASKPISLPKKLSTSPSLEEAVPAHNETATVTPESQTATVDTAAEKPNVLVRVWNFFKNLLGF